MKTSWVVAALVAAVMAAPAAWANGGGYTSGGVEATGGIKGFEPQQTGKVRICDENLSIRLRFHETVVEVRYILKNTSSDSANVKFGFPIEEIADESMEETGVNEAVANRKAPLFLKDYRVAIDGTNVKAAYQKETGHSGDVRYTGVAGWMISEIRFRPGEERTMTIAYSAKYPLQFYSVSDDGTVSAKTFCYRLSTGAAWEGPIERGRIVIESEGVVPSEVRVEKPANKFRKEGDRWIWDFENLEPTLADDIQVIAEPGYRDYGRTDWSDGKMIYSSFVERDGKWSARHGNYSVKASSTLAPQGEHRYDAENLRVDGWDSLWAEGAKGDGTGEWLEITPEIPATLRAIWVCPGYASDDEKFKANGRPRKVEVVLNDSYKFDAELDDEASYQAIRIPAFDKRVEKVKITVKSVYPGSRFEDLCITKIGLETALAKKPKIQPAR